MKRGFSKTSATELKPGEDQIKRLRGLVFLSALFFISGLLFFFMQTILQKPDPPRDYDQIQVDGLKTSSADLSKFQTFIYKPGLERVTVEGTCADKFYAIIIYPKAVDYKQNPQEAKYNVANPCPPSKHFKVSVPLYMPPFESGQTYYIIRASQGGKGVWYNPY